MSIYHTSISLFRKMAIPVASDPLVQDYGISYLFYGPNEQALGDFSPAEDKNFEVVYDNGVVRIYGIVDP